MKLIKVKKKDLEETFSQSVIENICQSFVRDALGTLQNFKSELSRDGGRLNPLRYTKAPEYLEGKKLSDEFEQQVNKMIEKLNNYSKRIKK